MASWQEALREKGYIPGYNCAVSINNAEAQIGFESGLCYGISNSKLFDVHAGSIYINYEGYKVTNMHTDREMSNLTEDQVEDALQELDIAHSDWS